MKKLSPIFILLFLILAAFQVRAQNPEPKKLSVLINDNNFKNCGLLSKFNFSLYDENFKHEKKFYTNQYAEQKSGLNTGYEFLEHLGTGMNIPNAGITDSSGNTYITGAVSNPDSPEGNFATIKVNANGEVVWEKRLPGTQYFVEFGNVITFDEDQNPVVSGIRWNGNDLDVYTIKYDRTSGETIWADNFDNEQQGLDVPTAITTDNEGNVIVAGISYTGNSYEFLILKYNNSGQLIWSVTEDGPIEQTWNEPTAVITDTNGNIALTGFGAVDGTSNGYWEGYITVLYSSEGEQIWRNTYLFERILDEWDPESPMTNTHSSAQSISLDITGNIYVTGTFDASAPRIGTIKYDTSGNEEWVNIYRGGEFQTDITEGHDIIAADNNTIYVGGRHRIGWINEGIVLISYDADGNENWAEETLNLIDIVTAKLTLNEANLPVISGMGYDEGTFDQRIRVMQYSEDGNPVKEVNYLKPQTGTANVQEFVNFTLDNDNNVYLILNNFYTQKGGVFETVKLNWDSGENNPDWNQIYETPLSRSNTRMLNSAVDSNDNLYVTGDYGVIENNQYYSNFFVAKYDDAGSLEWERSFNEQNGNETNGIMVKVNSNDEVLVFLVPGNTDTLPIRLKKFDPEGNLIWETEKQVYEPILRSFFLDHQNNIYIAGSSKENESDQWASFTTIKFSDSGNELWSRFTTTDNPDDFLFEINSGTATPQGEIILTGASGYSTMFSQVVDVTLLKYDTNGQLLWLNKYPQTNYASAGLDVTTDNDGNIYTIGVQQETLDMKEEMVMLKLDPTGNEIWTTSYGQSEIGRRIRPYAIRKNSEGDFIIPAYSLYWVIGESPNNRIATIKIKKETGEVVWVNNTEIDRFYGDSYIDGSDEFYIFTQVGTTALPQSMIGGHAIGGLTKVNPEGQATEDLYYGPELSLVVPGTIAPLSNGNLILGGHIFHEMDFFSGLYFFKAVHDPLSTNDDAGESLDNNWLGQNYPNPANLVTTIPFNITESGNVRIALVDVQGRIIRTLTNKHYTAGKHTLDVNLSGLPKGVYFYQMKSGSGFTKALRLIVK